MNKYIFNRYTDSSQKIVWADNLFIAIDMVGAGWNIFIIQK